MHLQAASQTRRAIDNASYRWFRYAHGIWSSNHTRRYHLHTEQTVEPIIYGTSLTDPKAHKIWKITPWNTATLLETIIQQP